MGLLLVTWVTQFPRIWIVVSVSRGTWIRDLNWTSPHTGEYCIYQSSGCLALPGAINSSMQCTVALKTGSPVPEYFITSWMDHSSGMWERWVSISSGIQIPNKYSNHWVPRQKEERETNLFVWVSGVRQSLNTSTTSGLIHVISGMNAPFLNFFRV